jgi:anti-sigma B factor antagonist
MNTAPERERRSEGEVAVLPLGGDLDLSTAPEVEREIRRAEARRPGVLVLDLGAVTFLDPSMLREIVAAHVRARRDGRRLAVAVASEAVRRVFRITLLEWRLEIVRDPTEVRVASGATPPLSRADA